jgi:hypothetical protein
MKPVDQMTKEEAVEFVQTSLEQSLKGFIGKPADLLDAKRVMEDELQHLLQTPVSPWTDALADVLVLDWAGIPEGFDPKAVLENVPTHILARFCDGLTGEVHGACGLVVLERQRRRGDVLDWAFERIDETHARTTMTLKEPMKYITLDVTLEPR